MASPNEEWHSETSSSSFDGAAMRFMLPDGCEHRMKEQKRRPKPRDGSQLTCGVCGDKALGYNFDAVTCESCKAFFRRNANKSKGFTCCFDGNCKLDPHTRKFCSGCRLKKCFTIGMKKDWILNDDQLAKRRQRLRARSGASSTSSCEQESGEISSTHMSEDVYSSPNPSFSYSPELKIKEEPVDDENYSIPLREDIQDSIAAIQKSYNEIFEAAYAIDQTKKLQNHPTDPSDLFNMTDIFIRRLIKFAKCIPEFKSLRQEDQIHLLKGGIMEMFVLRSAMSFDQNKNAWKFHAQISEGEIREGQLDSHALQNTIGNKMFVDHINFVRSIHELSGNDRIIHMLLFIIDLMSVDRPNLTNELLVSRAQEKFSLWLKAYLESVHTVAEARVLYPKLLMKLLDVRNLGEESSQLAASLDITKLEPLLIEVFDIKL